MESKGIPNLKVMVVEDDETLLQLYKELLPREWQVEYFSHPGKAAYQYSVDSKFDLVITDLKMLPKNGEGLIFDIMYVNPLQKVIVVSGYIDELRLPESFNVKVFEKPWDIRNVVDVFNTWLCAAGIDLTRAYKSNPFVSIKQRPAGAGVLRAAPVTPTPLYCDPKSLFRETDLHRHRA